MKILVYKRDGVDILEADSIEVESRYEKTLRVPYRDSGDEYRVSEFDLQDVYRIEIQL